MAGNFPSDFSDYEPRNPLSHPGRADFFLKIFRKIPGNLAEICRKRGQKSPIFPPLGGVAAPFFRSGGSGKQIARGFSGRSGRGCGGFLGLVMLGYHPPRKRLYGAFWGRCAGAMKKPRPGWAAVPGAGAAVAGWAGLCGLIWDGVKLGHGRRVLGRFWAAVEGIRKAPGRISQGRRVSFQ